MTCLIKKRINTELFIDRQAALYLGETQIKAVINMGGLTPVGLADLRIKNTLR